MMSVNLIELVKGQLGDSVLAQLGSLIGESTENTKNAVEASVPTLLGSIVDKVSSDTDAAGMLSNVLDNLDEGIADDFSGFIQPDKQPAIAEKGLGLLQGLLGDNLSSVVDMISKFSGVGNKSSTSMLSMILPLVLGFIGKQRNTAGLDQDGVLGLLNSQTDNIKTSMPTGMGDLLSGSGILSGLTSMLSTDAASNVVSDLSGAAADMASSAKEKVESAVGDAASDVAAAAEGMASSAKEKVESAVSDAASGAVDAAEGMASSAKEKVESAVSDAASGAVDAAEDLASSAKEKVESAVSDAASGAVDAAEDLASSAKEKVESAVSDAASGAADAVDQAAATGGSMIKKVLPIAIVVLVILFLLKNCM